MPKDGRLESYPWFIPEWRTSARVGALTAVQKCVYRELIDYYWELGSLPSDEHVLFKWCRVSAREWRLGRSVIGIFFRLGTDGRLHSDDIDEKRNKKMELKEKQRLGAKSTNEKKNADRDGDRDGERSAERDGERSGKQVGTRARSPSPSLSLSQSRAQAAAAAAAAGAEKSAAAAPLSAEEWNQPDPHQIAFELARELAPKHWVTSEIPRAQTELEAVLSIALHPLAVADSIRNCHEAWRSVDDRPKNIRRREFCYWIKDGLYLSPPTDDKSSEIANEIRLLEEQEAAEEERKEKHEAETIRNSQANRTTPVASIRRSN